MEKKKDDKIRGNMRKGKPVSKKELDEIIEKLRSGKMKIKPAPQTKLMKYRKIAEEFFTDILGYDIHKCLVTDWSTLDEFPENLKVYRKKIKAKYGIKLPTGYGDHLILVNIFEKINKSKSMVLAESHSNSTAYLKPASYKRKD